MPEPAASGWNGWPRVAVAGCGVTAASGRGLPALRAALRANAGGLRRVERFNHPRFQSALVGAAPSTAKADGDPAWTLATEALAEAVGAAQEILAALPPERIGLVLSTTKANIGALESISAGQPVSAAARRHLCADLLAADLAAAHGAGGPVQCVSLACVSGLAAIHQGMRLIQRGLADAVLVVGVDHLSAFVMAGFTALKAIDPNGCRPLDQHRSGLSPGEAGAALVLVRADLVPGPAVRILGTGSSNDANHLTGPARDGAGLVRAIRAALQAADRAPADLGYLNLHGTGTPYNDAMEAQALRTVFGDACPPFSGSKGLFGHTLGAAGVVETIVCVLALQDRFLPGTPRLTMAADTLPAGVVYEPRDATHLQYALKLSTGFGGVNGALLLGHE